MDNTKEWMEAHDVELSNKVDTDDPRLLNIGGSSEWVDITNKPAEFTPSSHTHLIQDITSLQSTLDSKAPINHTHETTIPDPVFSTLANGTTAMNLAANSAVKVTPTGNATFTTTVPPAGTLRQIIILTSGTVSRTITFGSGFKPTATLATGTTASRVFVISWVSDGTNLYETSRTVAMAA